MKKLYLELAVLFFTLFIAVWVIEKVYAGYQAPSDVVIGDYNKKKKGINTVLIGNSHIIAVGEPDLLGGKTFNLAMAGISMFDIVTLTRNLIAADSNTKNLVIGLDYDIVGVRSERSILSLQLYRYTDTLETNSLSQKIKARSDYFRSGQDIGYLLFGNDYSHKYVNEDSNKIRQNFIPLNFKSKNDEKACMRRALEHGSINFKQSNIQKNIALLNDLISLGKTHQLNLIFVCTPKTKCYSSTYLSLTEMQEAKKLLDKSFSESGLTYYDLTNDTTFNDDDFIDFDHLNQTGAEKLASIIQGKLRN